MTLLEVLVALTLMVIISAISFASLNGLIDAKQHTDEVAKNLRKELLVSQQLTNDIDSIIKRSVKDQFGLSKPDIIGDFSSVEFSRNGHGNPLKQFRAELQRVHWYVRDEKLYRRTTDFIDAGSFPKWQVRQYLDNVSELNMNFINSVGQESRTWPIDNSSFPLQSIEFKIEFNNQTSLKYLMSVLY